MSYAVLPLAPGSFDLLLNGEVIGGVVRNVRPNGETASWQVELLTDLPASECPPPFIAPLQLFESLEDALAWLGIAARTAVTRR